MLKHFLLCVSVDVVGVFVARGGAGRPVVACVLSSVIRAASHAARGVVSFSAFVSPAAQNWSDPVASFFSNPPFAASVPDI